MGECMSYTDTNDLLTQYEAQYNETLKADAPKWLKEYRANAFASFMAQGIPTTQWENWKYTHLRLWLKHQFLLNQKNDASAQAFELKLFSMLDENTQQIVFIDGYYQPEFSAKHLACIVLENNAKNIEVHAELIQKHMGSAIRWEGYPFASLCDAISQKGAIIIVPDNTVIEQPIHLLCVTSRNSEKCVNHLRHLVIVGKNSKINLIEHYVDLHDVVYFNNVVTEMILEENAKLSHYLLEQEGSQAFHIGALCVKQGKNTGFHSNAVTLSGHFSRHDMSTNLEGENAHCDMNGLYFTHHTQHVDYHTQIVHKAAHCTSASLYKGILADSSVSVFNGKVIVKENAHKTRSQQGNHHLLLSTHCEANSKPELEIYTDDVQCTHGATTGQLNPDALFFLQARGVALSKARRMLIRAFANEIFNKMESDIVRQYCQRYLEMAAYE